MKVGAYTHLSDFLKMVPGDFSPHPYESGVLTPQPPERFDS